MPRTIAVANFKGGVGKTTTTSNLAAALAKRGRRVLIVDFDSQGQAGAHFGLVGPFTKTVYRALTGELPYREAVLNIYEEKEKLGHERNEKSLRLIDLLPSGIDLSGMEYSGKIGSFALKSLLSAKAKDYDYVLIESAPGSRRLHANVAAAANEIIVPFIPDLFGINGTAKYLRDVLPGTSKAQKGKILLLPVMVIARSSVHAEGLKAAEDFAKTEKASFSNIFIPFSTANAKSVSFRQLPAVLGEPKAKISEAYTALAKVINKGITKKNKKQSL